MIAYLIQLLVFQALFLAVYELFLKKETFFSLNRAYLLVTPFVAAILPVLEFEILREAVPVENMVQLPVLLLSGANPELSETSAEMFASNPSGLLGFMETNWLLLIYLLGVLVALALFLKKYTQLLRIKKSGKTEKHGKINLVHIPSNRIASTFFNTVFLGENLSEVEKKQILAHELVHVGQRHSYDLMLFELLRIFLWFNPFIYRYQSQLSTLHEYIADEKTTQNSTQKDYFQELLNAAFGTRQIPFCNAFFNKSLIKKRIVMMKKPKSNRNAKLKYLLIIPLVLGMLTYVACSHEQIMDKSKDEDGIVAFEIEDLKTITEKQEAEILSEIHKIGLGNKKVIVKDLENKISFVYNRKEWEDDFIQTNPDGSVNFTCDEIIFHEGKYSHNGKEATITSPGNINVGYDSDGFKLFPPPPPAPPSPFDGNEIPFAAVDKIPVFPGCENLSKEEAKSCVSTKVRDFVANNFNTKLGKQLGLSGEQRIQVMFKIDETGNVVDVKARAPHLELQQEAIRVISMLPNMVPGKQDDRSVSVLYSLPIIFQVD